MNRRILFLFFCIVAGLPLSAQSNGLKYPRDKERSVASLWGKTITLGQIIDSLEKDYSKGCGEIFSSVTGTQTMDMNLPVLTLLQMDLMIIRREAEIRKITVSKEEIEKELLTRFKEATRKAIWRDPTREKTLRATEKYRLRVFKRLAGPKVEIKLTLDKMVPMRFTDKELKFFYQHNGRRSEIQVKLASIFVPRLDPKTGHLRDMKGLKALHETVLDIKSRIKKDGSNFSEVIDYCSRKKKDMAVKGGILGMVKRWNDKYPAITRAAFELRQGEWKGPLELADGFIFVKCLKILGMGRIYVHSQIRDELYTDMRRQKQEDLLVELRRKAEAKLLL